MQAMPDGESSPISAEQEFLRQELGQLYGAFVERLGERDRIFFRVRFEEQKTQVEAGAACGLSHMQSRTLEKKLREKFLKFMQTNGYLDNYGGATARGALKAI
jgi:DNA-directed RNA polymerase specialized sigma subunit